VRVLSSEVSKLIFNIQYDQKTYSFLIDSLPFMKKVEKKEKHLI